MTQNSQQVEQLQSELQEAKRRIEQIERSRRTISKELKQNKRRAKKQLKIALIVGAPVWILLLPALLVFYFIPRALEYFKKYRAARALGTDLLHKRLNRTVANAFTIYHTAGKDGGLAAAKRELATNADGISPGTIDLFDALDAKTDADWLDAMNRWCKASGKVALSLDKGKQDRFMRLNFAPLPEVDSPHLITVIMPCYNCASTVTKAVQSILNQSWRNLEVIAVDDASTDDTFAILTQLAKQDPRLRVLKNIVNVGPYVSKNRALTLARGTFVTGHDSDDLAFPDRLAQQMAPILANARCKATIGYSLRVDKFANFVWPPNGRSIYNYDGVLRLTYISLLIERETFDKLFGFWDSVRVAADGEILERTLNAMPEAISLVKSCGNLLFFHEGSLTQNVESELSLVSGHANVREDYKRAYRAWHGSTNKFKRQLRFPPNPRPFNVPAKIEVPLKDILELIKDD